MKIKFIEAGESPAPGVGTFAKDEERDLPTSIAESLIGHGVARVAQGVKVKKEVSDNG